MVSIHKNCQHCGEKLKASSNWNKKFCSDKCRVAWHREQKKPKFEEKYNNLVRSMHDSIIRLEKHAKKAEEMSQDMSKPLNDRMMLIAMFREKSEIAKELKLLLEMNGAPDSWQSYLNTTDPTKFD